MHVTIIFIEYVMNLEGCGKTQEELEGRGRSRNEVNTVLIYEILQKIKSI